jgi:cytochrome P450
LITYFAFDTIFRIAFSDNDIDEYKMDEILEGTQTRFIHWHRWFALPDLEKLIYKNPLATRITPTSFLGQKATERIQQRNEEGGLGTHSDLLDRYLQAEKKAPTIFGPATITGLVMSIINAGSETTSSTLNTVMFNLLYNPQAMAALRKELDSANLSFPPTYNSVAKLRYMDAAIKESLRLNLVFVEPLEREVPPGGAHIAGVFIPGGTAVAMNGHALGHNREIWGDEPEKYRPERWLEADESQRSKMERCNLSFGAGKRMCIGQHIAWIEMKKVLPALLMKFEVRYIVSFLLSINAHLGQCSSWLFFSFLFLHLRHPVFVVFFLTKYSQFELVDPNRPLQKTNILIGLVQDLFVRVRGRELQGSRNHL